MAPAFKSERGLVLRLLRPSWLPALLPDTARPCGSRQPLWFSRYSRRCGFKERRNIVAKKFNPGRGELGAAIFKFSSVAKLEFVLEEVRPLGRTGALSKRGL